MGPDFEFAFQYTLQNEGHFSNVPQDHGGATNMGITQSTLARWRGHAVSVQDVKELKVAEAKAIYKKWYWDTLSLDEVDSTAKATAIFDTGVVRGIHRAAIFAQNACNLADHADLKLDGHLGPKSLQAINKADDKEWLRQYEIMVENAYRTIIGNNPSQHIFLSGWLRRTRRLLTLLPN